MSRAGHHLRSQIRRHLRLSYRLLAVSAVLLSGTLTTWPFGGVRVLLGLAIYFDISYRLDVSPS